MFEEVGVRSKEMKVCFCESGDLGRAGDYTTIKEATINAGVFGKGSATLAMIGGVAKCALMYQ